jgi:hypothetical protein
MKIDELIFRCHSLGDLMGVKGLGLTGQKRAMHTYIEVFEGRTSEIKSKYLEKGIYNEPEAIKLVNEVLQTDYKKNEVRLANDLITGECDIETIDEIVDVKCSWDRFTFLDAFKGGGLDYEWQLRGYMQLYEKRKASVIYCLTDKPDEMMLKELERKANFYGGDLPDMIAIQMVVNSYFDKDNFNRFLEMAPIDMNNKYVKRAVDNFVHIPKENRIKRFQFDYSDSSNAKIGERVNDARNYLKTIFNES